MNLNIPGNIEHVLATAPVGNAYSDHDLWQDLYGIASDPALPLATRARAVRKMDEVTGVPESKGQDDVALMTRYIAEMKEHCGVDVPPIVVEP